MLTYCGEEEEEEEEEEGGKATRPMRLATSRKVAATLRLVTRVCATFLLPLFMKSWFHGCEIMISWLWYHDFMTMKLCVRYKGHECIGMISWSWNHGNTFMPLLHHFYIGMMNFEATLPGWCLIIFFSQETSDRLCMQNVLYVHLLIYLPHNFKEMMFLH